MREMGKVQLFDCYTAVQDIRKQITKTNKAPILLLKRVLGENEINNTKLYVNLMNTHALGKIKFHNFKAYMLDQLYSQF